MNKIGSSEVGTLLPAVTAFIMFGMLVGAGLLVFGSFEEATWDDTVYSKVNESVKPVTAGTDVAAATMRNCNNLVIASVENGSGTATPKLISSENYTVSGCKLVNLTGEFITVAWNVSYSIHYDADSVTSNGTRDVGTAIGDLASTWLPVIIVVFAAGIVLAILMRSLSPRKTK